MPDIRFIRRAVCRLSRDVRRCLIGMTGALGVFWSLDGVAHAGHVLLDNGLLIKGKPSKVQSVSPDIVVETGGINEIYPIVMVDSEMVRYFVRDRRVQDINKDATLGSIDVFKLKNRPGHRTSLPSFIGAPLEVTEFDVDGRRSLTLMTPRGPVQCQQGITEIGPEHIKVSTLGSDKIAGLAWDFSLPTTSLRPQRLDEMIRKVTDQKKPTDRLTIARFYVSAGRYVEALRELENIAHEFPEHADRTNEFTIEARQQLADQLLSELTARRGRNQHRLAYSIAKQFPTEQLNAGALRKLREFITEYDTAQDDVERAIALLGELQGQIRSEAQREALEALRSEVAEQLNFETLPRLKPFLRQADDESKPADERLALAYSGWLLGEGAAVETLPKVLNLAKARVLMLKYLRETDAHTRQLLVTDVLKVEGIGAQSVLALINHLPLPLDTPQAVVGKPFPVTVSQPHSGVEGEDVPVTYHALLPQEYSSTHRYPLVVTLRPIERPIEWSLRWWGGNADEPLQAQRHGYIVIAPDYLEPKATGYGYGALSHYAVLQAIRDARKRFNIDSDRIYLSGHAEGGDAAFDIGLSHPDEFAGVIPITGIVGDIPIRLKQNGRYTGLFVINGQLDRALSVPSGKKTNPNLGTINSMMMPGNQDVLYAEYVGRGNESYYGEIHRLFAWMEAHRRVPSPRGFTVFSMRPNDNRFFWVKAHTLPNASPATSRTSKTRLTPVPVAVQSEPNQFIVKVADGAKDHNSITVPPFKTTYTLWLHPEIVSFDKRLRVFQGTTPKYNDFVEPQIETMLEDLRTRGDRQRVFQAKIEVR